MKLGYHVSIADGIDRSVERAVELGCDTFQIFTRNPRSWASRPLREGEAEAFRAKRAEAGLDPAVGHMPYILNLASPVDGIYERSVASLRLGLERCDVLGVAFLVTHLGSHLGSGVEAGLGRVVKALDGVIAEDGSDVVVLLENGAGSENGVGSRFEELGRIIREVELPERVAVCLDTCHTFVAGYDLRTPEALGGTLDAFESSVGLDVIRVIHLNDSVGSLGSGRDHHEHIGLGEIGLDGFWAILGSPLSRLPMIMETPQDERREEGENLRIVRDMAESLRH
ncbi:MAG TPA: deoxyribonuclease IV [Patescibacteria group bacterium]|nr:deoxyribonuclease IV [Patescibacteria group bacterium]